jgi:16S rRNA (cytidine1402-2'-O)-methyltransferase
VSGDRPDRDEGSPESEERAPRPDERAAEPDESLPEADERAPEPDDRAPEPAPLAGHRLTLVPTPIGHLDDITLRALKTLREADVVAAEDTRRSRTLLLRHGVDTPLVRLDAHTMGERARGILGAHPHVAYVTDAGTPGISDPGADLVRLALGLGVRVEALPGPTAFVPALVLSGLAVHRFAFEGFLPRKGRERRDRLAQLAGRDHTSALYESAARLLATLADLAAVCGGDRPAAVARELSKRFEAVERGSLAELSARFEARPARGEIVVVVGAAASGALAAGIGPVGAVPQVLAAADDEALARRLAAEGAWGRELRSALEEAGVGRDRAYALAVRFGRRPS